MPPTRTRRSPRAHLHESALVPSPHGPRSEDELLLGLLLTVPRMLATGRRLLEYPMLHHLSGEQLIEFWADHEMDEAPADRPGRLGRPEPPGRPA